MDSTKWAKVNKKRIAREFIRRVEPTADKSAYGIFTAGLPGAGKTEFTVELIKGIKPQPLRVDMDEVARLIEGYSPKSADQFRGGASIILSRIYDEIIKHKMNFVFDGTFSSEGAISNIKRALAHGYKVKVYYIHQLPEVAWQFTKDRELVEHRSIELEGFKETYFKLEKNLQELCKNHKEVTISLVIKDDKNRVGRIIENVNDKLFDELTAFFEPKELDSVIM